MTGIHVFYLETFNEVYDAHARNFTPRYGIVEEAATGTSNGAVVCYLRNNLKSRFDGNFTIGQVY